MYIMSLYWKGSMTIFLGTKEGERNKLFPIKTVTVPQNRFDNFPELASLASTFAVCRGHPLLSGLDSPSSASDNLRWSSRIWAKMKPKFPGPQPNSELDLDFFLVTKNQGFFGPKKNVVTARHQDLGLSGESSSGCTWHRPMSSVV